MYVCMYVSKAFNCVIILTVHLDCIGYYNIAGKADKFNSITVIINDFWGMRK